MEDVLDLYEEEYDPRYRAVCFDEKLKAIVADVRSQWHRDRQNASITKMSAWAPPMCFSTPSPLSGWRHVEMTEHRTKIDYARCIQWPVDTVYPQAEYMRIVQDNLNTHTAVALHEAFPPAEAQCILQQVEFHFTCYPWKLARALAEIEIAIFTWGCLLCRVENMQGLRERIATLEAERNA